MKPIDTKNFELEAKFLFESHANIGLLALSASMVDWLLASQVGGTPSGGTLSIDMDNPAVTGVAVVYIKAGMNQITRRSFETSVLSLC
jgi:hypothetical protein